MGELKSCPFCGGEALISNIIIAPEIVHSITCIKCKIESKYSIDKNKIIEAWNTRATGWISADTPPEKDGRYLVVEDHSYKWVGVATMRQGKFDIEIKWWQPLPPAPEPPKDE